MIRSIRLVLAAVLVAAASPAWSAGAELLDLLRAVPVPADPARILDSPVLFAYADLRRLWDPAAFPPGTDRIGRIAARPLPVLRLAGLLATLPIAAETWPGLVGFSPDAVDAVLVAPVAGGLPPTPLRVLGLRPPGPVGVDGALLRRGFTQEARDGVTLFARGADNELSVGRRTRGDPFDPGVGMAERIAIAGDTMLVTAATPVMDRALSARAGQARSFAETDGARALLAGLETDRPLQLIALSGAAAFAETVPAPAMPPWVVAMLADLVAPPGRIRQRLVVAAPDVTALIAPLRARLADPARCAAAEPGLRPLSRRFGGLGALVVDFDMPAGTPFERSPVYCWWTDILLGRPTPLSLVATPAQRPGLSPR